MDIEERPIESVRPYDANPRVNDPGVDAVARSLQEFGWRQPIVVDEESVIVVGHTRFKAARKLGMKTVPVHVAVGLSPEQLRAYRIADNQTASFSTWDDDLLVQELEALKDVGYDLGLTGFTGDELMEMLGTPAVEGLTDPDEAPEPPEDPVTRPGDLWLLGEHRLLCGDSTSEEHVARLMGGSQARMLFTDPPWNVAIGKDSNPRHRQRKGLANDDLSPEQFRAFLDAFLKAGGPYISGDLYCVLGASEWPTLDSALRQAGFHWSATVVWVKDVFVLGRSKFHRRYEPIWYGWREGGKSSFCGRRDLDDVWEVPRPKRSEEHPTMKPVALPVRAITASSKAGDVVLDLFGGSGSTLIAAEQTERKACLMELDPGYCDVIVNRYEQFTGKKAERG